MMTYYIASCVFTSKYPELSCKIQQYVSERFNISVVRCCVPNYQTAHFRRQMPEGYRVRWNELPNCGDCNGQDTDCKM